MRRAASLDGRAVRVEEEIAGEQGQLDAAQRTVREGERAERRGGFTHTEERRQERARWLDTQAALPDMCGPGARGERRDYPALAGLVGYERGEYERLSASSQRQTG